MNYNLLNVNLWNSEEDKYVIEFDFLNCMNVIPIENWNNDRFRQFIKNIDDQRSDFLKFYNINGEIEKFEYQHHTKKFKYLKNSKKLQPKEEYFIMNDIAIKYLYTMHESIQKYIADPKIYTKGPYNV
jgi:hypothetical protein